MSFRGFDRKTKCPNSPLRVSNAMTRQRIFYRVRQLAALVLVGSWCWWCLREMNYVSYSRIPLPQFGQVVPHTTKRIIVYITPQDEHFDTLLIRICVGAGIVSAIFLVVSGELSKMLKSSKTTATPRTIGTVIR